MLAADWTQSEVAGRLIVRFHSYKPAAAHKVELAALVTGQGSAWHWVDRANAAAAYPTDFALLDVLDAHAKQVKVICFHLDSMYMIDTAVHPVFFMRMHL